MATVFTNAELNTLSAILDTVVAPLNEEEQDAFSTKYVNNVVRSQGDQANAHEAIATYCKLSGSAYKDRVVDLLAKKASPDKLKEFQKLLRMLSSRTGTLLLTGSFGPFQSLPRERREAILLKWKKSKLGLFFTLYKTFFDLSTWPLYSEPGFPAHHAMGYVDHDDAEPHPNREVDPLPGRLPMVSLEELLSTSVSVPKFDVIVVGSGAGGGTCAAQLSQAGYSVLVIEKGKYYHETEFIRHEKQSFANLYENGSILQSSSGGAAIIAGSTIGGGTTVNWSASLKPQHFVREEWAKKHGLSHFLSSTFSDDLEKVCNRIGASTSGIKHNNPNQILINGCRKLGYHVEDVPQNTAGRSHECGWCNWGCVHAIKNGTMNAWLRDAEQHGAKFMDSTKVLRVLIKDHRAYGVECIDAHGTKGIIHADVVVVSGGSLNTPGILLRSGLKNRHIGRNLHLHPTGFVAGVFDKPVDPFRGSILTTVSNAVENVTGDGYGAKIEVPAMQPGVFANLMPWTGSAGHKETMMQFGNTAVLLVLVRDKNSKGIVKSDANGSPSFDYVMSKTDKKSMLAGIISSCKILCAAGARVIRTRMVQVNPFHFRDDEESQVDNPRFKQWLEHIRRCGMNDVGLSLFGSGHQMSTCRMGASKKKSVTKPTGETWEVKNLYVADASLFPTATGVNPMVTVETIALHVARSIIHALGGENSAHLKL